MSLLLIILVVILLLSAVGGAWAYPTYGYAGWSPVGLILLIFVVLLFLGRI